MDPDETSVGASVQEVLAELSERGRLEWEAAVGRVENRKLREELARLRNEQQARGPVDPTTNGVVPPAGEPDPVPTP